MRKPSSKEVMVFCDKETQTATIRIFKFRNYVWAGGKTLEFKKDSQKLQRVFDSIIEFSVETMDKSSILWKEDNESAITYILDMDKKNEK